MANVQVLTWDWREQPDLDRLGRLIEEMSGRRLHLYQADTGSDQYAIVISDTPLSDEAVQHAYRSEWEA